MVFLRRGLMILPSDVRVSVKNTFLHIEIPEPADNECVATTAPGRLCGSLALSLEHASLPSAPKHVTFNMEANSVHDVTPYGEVYGARPCTFVFDEEFNMIPAVAYGRNRGFVSCLWTEPSMEDSSDDEEDFSDDEEDSSDEEEDDSFLYKSKRGGRWADNPEYLDIDEDICSSIASIKGLSDDEDNLLQYNDEAYFSCRGAELDSDYIDDEGTWRPKLELASGRSESASLCCS